MHGFTTTNNDIAMTITITNITTITSTSTAEAGTEGVKGEDGSLILGRDSGCYLLITS